VGAVGRYAQRPLLFTIGVAAVLALFTFTPGATAGNTPHLTSMSVSTRELTSGSEGCAVSAGSPGDGVLRPLWQEAVRRVSLLLPVRLRAAAAALLGVALMEQASERGSQEVA
jgi:hypothetical protein